MGTSHNIRSPHQWFPYNFTAQVRIAMRIESVKMALRLFMEVIHMRLNMSSICMRTLTFGCASYAVRYCITVFGNLSWFSLLFYSPIPVCRCSLHCQCMNIFLNAYASARDSKANIESTIPLLCGNELHFLYRLFSTVPRQNSARQSRASDESEQISIKCRRPFTCAKAQINVHIILFYFILF